MSTKEWQSWIGLPDFETLRGEEAYELTLSPSFDPVVYCRIVKDGELVADGRQGRFGRRGYDSTHAWLRAMFQAEPIRTHRSPSESDWLSLVQAVEAAGFWDAPPDEDGGVLDGVTWTIRGVRGEKRHHVARSSPEPGPFRALGEQIVAMAGIDALSLRRMTSA